MVFAEFSPVSPQPLAPNGVSVGEVFAVSTAPSLFPELGIGPEGTWNRASASDPSLPGEAGLGSDGAAIDPTALPPPPDNPSAGIRATDLSRLTPVTSIIDSTGNTYTVGYFTGTVDVDPSDRAFMLTSQGGSDLFVSKFDSTGNLLWARGWGGSQNDRASDIVVDEQGNLHVVGVFAGVVDFDPSDRDLLLTSLTGEDVFALTLDSQGNFINALANQQQNIERNAPIVGAEIELVGTGGSFRVGIIQAVPDASPLPLPPIVADQPWVPILEDTNQDGIPDQMRVDCECKSAIPVRQQTWTIDAQTANRLTQPHTQVATVADFNRDGYPDFLVRDTLSGESNVWLMNRRGLQAIDFANTLPDNHWRVAVVEDFNHDGKVDLIWRNYETGENRLWWMNGTTINSVDVLPAMAASDWQVVATADFNQDGQIDVLWRDTTSGQTLIWLMQQSLVQSMVAMTAIAEADWTLVDTRDRNQDGQPDLLWQRPDQQEEMLWEMKGTQVRQITTRSLAPATYAGMDWQELPQSLQLILVLVISLLFINQRRLDVLQVESIS